MPIAVGISKARYFNWMVTPPNRSRHFSADLWATKLQNRAIGVLQLNASSASRNGTTAPIRCISLGSKLAPQIERPPDELGG
jgi:hypothetical protein